MFGIAFLMELSRFGMQYLSKINNAGDVYVHLF